MIAKLLAVNNNKLPNAKTLPWALVKYLKNNARKLIVPRGVFLNVNMTLKTKLT